MLCWYRLVSGSTLVSSSLDKSLRVYDLSAGGRCTRTLTEHDGYVSAVVALPDGNTVASSASDSSVRVWDLRADQPCVATLFDHEAAVYGLVALRHDPDTLVSGSFDHTVKIWSLRMPPPAGRDLSAVGRLGGRCVRTLRGHSDAVRCLVQLDDRHVATGSWDNTVRVWDLQSETLESEMQHDLPSADSTSTSSSSERVGPGHSCVGVLRGHSAWVYALAYLPSSQSIVSGSGDKTLRITHVPSLTATNVITGHENTIWSVAALPGAATAAASSTPTSPASGTPAGLSFASSGGDGELRLWNLSTESCVRISGGHVPTPQQTLPSIHALDVWPPIREDPQATTPIVFQQRVHEQDTADDRTLLAAASPAAAPSTKTSTDAARDGLYSESLEHRPFALRSSSQGPVEFSSQLEHHSLSKAAAGLERSVVGSVSITGAAHTSFEPAPAQFLRPQDHDAIVAKAAEAAEKAKAAAATESNKAQASPSAVTTAAAAAPASPSAPANASALFAALRPLRAQALSAMQTKDHVAAERALLEMIDAVEAEQERPIPPPSLATTSPALSASSLSALLCSLLHDASVCAFAQGACAAALRYGTRALAAFEGDAAHTHLHHDDSDDDSEDEDTDAETTQKQKEVAAKRRADERRLLLEVPRSTTDDFADMIPSELTIIANISYWQDAAATNGSLSPSSKPSVVAPVVPAPSSLYLPLQLRRFYCAILAGEANLAQRLGAELLARVSSTDQQRESILDEIETALLASHNRRIPPAQAIADASVATSPSSNGTGMPLHSLYAHLVYLYHHEVLVAVAYQRMQKANKLKEQGNEYFAQAGANAVAAAAAAKETAGVSAAPAVTASATSAAAPRSLYVDAALCYNQSLVLLQDLEDVLLDSSQESHCPSFMLFELAAAQIPHDPTRKQQQDRSNLIAPSPAGNMILQSSLSNNTGGNSTIPPFSMHSLHFLRASLHSNFAMAVLKLSDEQYAAVAELPPPSTYAHAATTSGFARGRRRGAHKGRSGPSSQRGTAVSEPPLAPSELRLLAVQRACEAGIELMEDLGRILPSLRSEVANATRAPAAYKGKLSATHEDDDTERNVYVEHLELGRSLPSASACASLSSKLYFRHGCAALDRGQDNVADLSFGLATKMQPDEKVRKEIEQRKKIRKAVLDRQYRAEMLAKKQAAATAATDGEAGEEQKKRTQPAAAGQVPPTPTD